MCCRTIVPFTVRDVRTGGVRLIHTEVKPPMTVHLEGALGTSVYSKLLQVATDRLTMLDLKGK